MKVNVIVWADGTANTECYWSERRQRWIFVDMLNEAVTIAEAWVEVTIDGADAEEGLNQLSIACDLEGRGLWVIRQEDLEGLEMIYQDTMTVLRRGTDDGTLIS